MSDQNNAPSGGLPDISFDIGPERIAQIKRQLGEIEKGKQLIPLLQQLGFQVDDAQANLDWAEKVLKNFEALYDDAGRLRPPESE